MGRCRTEDSLEAAGLEVVTTNWVKSEDRRGSGAEQRWGELRDRKEKSSQDFGLAVGCNGSGPTGLTGEGEMAAWVLGNRLGGQ